MVEYQVQNEIVIQTVVHTGNEKSGGNPLDDCMAKRRRVVVLPLSRRFLAKYLFYDVGGRQLIAMDTRQEHLVQVVLFRLLADFVNDHPGIFSMAFLWSLAYGGKL